MDLEEFNIVQLELKYCERCGGLWVRQLGSGEIYCASCAIEMADVESSSRRKSPPRLPGNHKKDGISGPRVVIISGEGGNA